MYKPYISPYNYDHYVGKTFFRPGEPVYINKVTESPGAFIHSHNFLEITYVVAGNGEHIIGDREYDVIAGDLFIINCDVPHVIRPRIGLLTLYNCIFLPTFLDFSLANSHKFKEIGNSFLFRSVFPDRNILDTDIRFYASDRLILDELFQKMLNEYESCEKGYIEMLRAYVIELLVFIFRRNFRGSAENNEIDNLQWKNIEKTIRYIHANFKKRIKVDNLSSMACMSASNYCRLFKTITGMTVTGYIQERRINEACRLLRETKLSIAWIAHLVGYEDIKFFYSVFKHKRGCTPGEYTRTQEDHPLIHAQP